MEARELRIGNLIYEGGDNNISIVVNIVRDMINPYMFCEIEPTGLLQEPITLTEEILLKCGFAWNIGKSAMWNEHEFLIGKDDEGFYFAQWQYDSNEEPYPSHIVHITTLHDLQNLYKLITRQELDTSKLL